MGLRIWNLVVLSLILASGCITAPVGFYESAFSSDGLFSGGLGAELGRNYEGIIYDTAGSDERSGPTRLIYPQWVSVSPFSWFSVGPEITNIISSDCFYGGLRAKTTIFNKDNAAAALIFRGGKGKWEEASDSWGFMGPIEPPREFTIYKITYVEGAGIFSYSLLGAWNKGARPGRISLNAGPKVSFTRLDYYHTEHHKDLWDFGGFVGLNGETGFSYSVLSLGLELSLLSVERPLTNERTWTPFLGVAISGKGSF
jgi:hypothetical protein